MAAYNKFNAFALDLINGKHVFNGSGATYKAMLTNTAPVATNSQYSDISGNELANGNGYTTGGQSITGSMSDSQASGTAKVLATNVTWTASGSMNPFRYVVVYRSDSTNKELVAWFDYGSSITLSSGDTFTVSFDGTNGLFQLS
jgi:hypothetical protein